ncbi:UNVERIFIED_CONTAM: hypothetical protein RMT77_000364 [Armadillidium vulgare]
MIENWIETTIWSAIIFTIIIILIKLSRRSMNHDLRARDIPKGHHWCYSGIISQPSYCNICETLITGSEGAFCGACGICADQPDCVTAANSELQCKEIIYKGSKLRHHWIKGNLPLGATCDVCEDECGTEIGLSDFRCCWCQGCCHASCLNKLSEICDLGHLRQFVVPPNNIKVRSGRIRKRLVIKEVIPPTIPDWSPVIVIGNCSSGSSEAEQILSAFRNVLNPAQVVDLSKRSPEEALEWCHLLSDITCKVIVAGGDGTVGWVFDTIFKLKLKHPPIVSILPLGTGNDLSRVLGWGESHSGSICAEEYLQKVNKAGTVSLDRWNVHFTAPRIFGGLRMPSREIYMNNYLSVGVDALVTLNFHLARQSPFYLFKSRTINKLIYFTYGTKDVLLNECKNLERRLELWMDGKKIKLPDMEALVILNIGCWGAGVRPWAMGPGGHEAPKQFLDDGRLEVFCVSSSFHIAQLQLGIGEPIRIGQCSSLNICLNGSAPMQVDGEPWEQTSGSISIRFSHKARVSRVSDVDS